MRVQADVAAHRVLSPWGSHAYDVPADRCVVKVNDFTHDVEAAKIEAARTIHRRAGIPPLRSLLRQTAARIQLSEHYDPREEAQRKMKR